MIGHEIVDGTGEGYKARVDQFHSLQVVDVRYPQIGATAELRIFRDYMRNSAGSLDMRVNGSTNPVEFTINADNTKDRYINTLSVVISDAGADLSEFGAIAALTNGCQLLYRDEEGDTLIAESLKTNFDFVRLGLGNPAFGDAATAFKANNVAGTSEAFLPVISFEKIFGIPFGIKLAAKSTDQLVLRVRDNLTAVDQFDIIAYGVERGL